MSPDVHADAVLESEYDVVVFGPHPDDVEMTMAGTIIQMVRAGRRILNVSLTKGERGTYGDPETRRKEFAAANQVMGTAGYLMDFPDTAVTNDHEGKLKIAAVVRKTRPRIVFAPYHTNPFGHHDGSANVDHYTTGQVVRDGLKLARFRNLLPDLTPHDVSHLYYFMVPKDRLPTIVVDVTNDMDTVHAAIGAYATQMSIHRRDTRIMEMLDALRRYHGIRIGASFGEAFLSDEALPFGPEEFFRPHDR